MKRERAIEILELHNKWRRDNDEEDFEDFEDEYDDEPDYSDFNCTCGAWRWSTKEGKPIHVADCCCGSSEPWF